MEGFVSRRTSLAENVILFCRYLRGHGYSVGPNAQSDALKAMTLVSVNSWEELCTLLKLTICKSKKQTLDFDRLFYEFWQELNKAVDSKEKTSATEEKNSKSQHGKKPSFDALKSWLYGNNENEQKETALYSDHVSLFQKDFSTFTDDELWELKNIIRKIAKSIVNRKIRRFETTTEHKNIDLKKVIRNNLKRGGEMIDLFYRKNKETDLSLVILCDVSKSMELYSRFLIQFLYAFQHVYRRIETFVFNTSLYHVSPQLVHKNFDRALKDLTKSTNYWASGTKIGHSFRIFIQDYGHLYLNKKAVVVIVSDGWDTGDTALLKQSMEKIYRYSNKVIWLNPLGGVPDFTPDVIGMKCAWPYIDIFAPVHNIESLKKLPGYLLGTRRKREMLKS